MVHTELRPDDEPGSRSHAIRFARQTVSLRLLGWTCSGSISIGVGAWPPAISGTLTYIQSLATYAILSAILCYATLPVVGGNTEGGKKSFNPLLAATACGSVQFCACVETTWQRSLRVRSNLVLTSA